jgi:hypothetical protein
VARPYLGIRGRHLLLDDDLDALQRADDRLVVSVHSQVADTRHGEASDLVQQRRAVTNEFYAQHDAATEAIRRKGRTSTLLERHSEMMDGMPFKPAEQGARGTGLTYYARERRDSTAYC